MCHLAEFPNLRYLRLDSTNVTGKGLVHLRKNRQLRSLVLGDLPINPAQLSVLQAMPKLQEVNFEGSTLSKADQQDFLSNLPSQRIVDSEALVRDFDASFQQYRGAISLRINSPDFGDDDVSAIEAFVANVDHLDLSGSGVTDAGLRVIAAEFNLQGLQTITLSDTGVSSDGIEYLRKKIPQVTIVHTLK